MPPNGPRERRAAARLKVMQLMLLLPPPLPPPLPLSSRGCQKQGYAKSGEQMGSPSYVLADGGREREREGEGSTPSSLGGQSVQRRLACRNSPFPPLGIPTGNLLLFTERVPPGVKPALGDARHDCSSFTRTLSENVPSDSRAADKSRRKECILSKRNRKWNARIMQI